ncbi:hypothetical protein AVEN_243122-1 [Araneus ventricosus]|uniref:Uncharacterized protein n=1 Tax=Araneus ventricosus TaxID=182803 RepID=A0A4Y2NHZ2_ARAVE|nr:hypothetical protein AVEN_243122-1 [Araneus ventricosus]
MKPIDMLSNSIDYFSAWNRISNAETISTNTLRSAHFGLFNSSFSASGYYARPFIISVIRVAILQNEDQLIRGRPTLNRSAQLLPSVNTAGFSGISVQRRPKHLTRSRNWQ